MRIICLRLTTLLGLVMLCSCNDVTAPNIARVYKDVATGGDHSCAISIDGTAFCWGRGLDGELGNGSQANTATPSRVVGGILFTEITAGANHTCALATDGVGYCWGWNAFFQRGNSSDTHESQPVRLDTNVKFRGITAGAHHACALGADSLAYCWGNNTFGQLGDGTTNIGIRPKTVNGAIKFIQLNAGAWHTCGVSVNGALYCWGRNDQGQLGIGSSDLTSTVPQQVNTTIRFIQVDGGNSHTCAVSVGRTFYCWGSSAHGEIGNGGVFKPDVAASFTPVAVSENFSTGRLIFAGTEYTCAVGLTPASLGRCWGRNDFGQIANAVRDDQYYPQPFMLPGAPELTINKFSTDGNTHGCALVDEAVFCWGGDAFGQVGNGTATFIALPQRVHD